MRSLAVSGVALTGATAAGAMALGGEEAARPAASTPAPAVRVPLATFGAPDAGVTGLTGATGVSGPTGVTGLTSASQAAKRKRPGREYYRRTVTRRVPAATETSFLPLYREAERAFGVSWRLVASIHRQETAFSTAPTTYKGRNAFGCCAGPMQFNVTNGPVSTWKAYRDAFKQAERPASYPHRTSFHPSIYDDFDAIMAAGALLRDNGATRALDGPSWLAAYLYYGRDLFGITYANQVVARARGWAKSGFDANAAADPALEARLDDAFGVGERQKLLAGDAAAAAAEAKAKKAKAKKAKAERVKVKRERAKREKAEAAERAGTGKASGASEAAPSGTAKEPGAKPKPKPADSAKPTPAPASPTTSTSTTPAPSRPPSEPPTSSPPADAPPESGSTCANLAGVGCG